MSLTMQEQKKRNQIESVIAEKNDENSDEENQQKPKKQVVP